MTTISSNPITLLELTQRGLDEDCQEILSMISETCPKFIPLEISHALGYGAPCPCGERGLFPGEIVEGETCKDCLESSD